MLMEGIEVLNQIEIMGRSPKLVVIALTFGILFCIFAISAIVSAIVKKDTACGIFGTFMFITFLCFIVTKSASNKEIIPTSKYKYQVTIDDSVSMTEFYEKYEIIDIEGKIYTIKIKEVD